MLRSDRHGLENVGTERAAFILEGIVIKNAQSASYQPFMGAGAKPVRNNFRWRGCDPGTAMSRNPLPMRRLRATPGLARRQPRLERLRVKLPDGARTTL